MLDTETIRKALEKGSAEKRIFGTAVDLHFDTLEYIRFRSTYSGIERGSVATKTDFLPGFPHIKRIFTLENGLEKNIKSEVVFAEEKIDGYNVRAASINGIIYAFSRGGIIDGFSTEKLRELIPKKVFVKKFMLCGEMIGNTPYTPPAKEFDIKYFVFDVLDLENKKYLAPEERYAFLKKHGLVPAPFLGKFHKKNDIKKLNELALNLNKAGKEGIVLKSEDRTEIVKYVNSSADIQDIGNTIKMLFDMPIGYFNQRLLRSAIFIKEHKLGVEAHAKKLGLAVYSNFINGLSVLEKEGAVYDEFEISIKDKAVWTELKSHMSKEVRLETVFEKEENGKFRIRFKKIYIKTTKKLRDFLNGKGQTD